MDEMQQWLRLLNGIISATSEKRLVWRRSKPNGAFSIGSMRLIDSLNNTRSYDATKSGVHYRLQSSDRFGGAPYQLRITEEHSGSSEPDLEFSSSLDVETDMLMLNATLRRLFVAVEEKFEPSEVTVARLLRGLEE